MTAVEFHFDLMCPWAYETSKWIREASRDRAIEVTWSFFSLEEAAWHEGSKHPWERVWSYGWSLLRLAALIGRGPDGNAAVGEFYGVAGRMLHEEGMPVFTPEGAQAALQRSELDPRLLDAALEDETTAEEVRAAHQRAVERGVQGVPTLLIEREHVLFGPVVTPAPTGPAAARLWDLVVGWTEFPHLYELQRTKLPEDLAHIARSFSPYSVARGWKVGE